MAAGGGSGGNWWVGVLVAGGVMVAAGMGMHSAHVGPVWLAAALLGLGGLGVVFGSCEAMIKAVEGVAARTGLNEFVAGQMAGLASNLPELVMLGFVLAAEPRVGFIVAMLTLHVGAATFGIYSGLLPRDATGHAKLPEPLVKLSTDLYACAGAVFFATGSLMAVMHIFAKGDHDGVVASLGATDLYVLGGALIFVEVVAVVRLVKRFSGTGDAIDEANVEEADHGESTSESPEEPPSVASIVGFGVLGLSTSIVGGHAVGDFADILVKGLTAAGYSQMVGALILAVFACAAALAMIVTAHAKGMYDIALANVSGQINQVPFVILPVTLILLAVFAQVGVIPTLASGGILPIDLQTTSVVLLGFPSMLLLWKAVQDDGTVNWVETATMVAIFAIIIYFLASHG
jgi:Sodium/calcium exchanger protein